MVVRSLIVKVPDPSAEALLIFSVPPDKDRPPEKELAPLNVKLPAPYFVTEYAPVIVPPTVNSFAIVVTALLVDSVTPPFPRFKLFAPKKTKLPPHTCELFLLLEIATPLVLSIAVLLPMVNNPVPPPSADALLMLRVPPDKETPPENAFAPERVSVPDPVFVKLNAPLIIPATVKLFPVVARDILEPIFTIPEPRFKSLVPKNVKLPFHC